MAKKSKKRPQPRPPIAPRAETPKPAPAPAKAKAIAAPQRSWWLDFELAREHVALFRFVFFAVLAVDAFLQISHAPRYGAGDFNVPHFAWLPLPVGRDAMLALDLILMHLFVLAAFGVATRWVVPLAAGLDAYYYFSSQLDSYQHHYLVVLLLIIASFVPWHSRDRYVKSWALRLLMVQIALLYAWAAIAKLHPLWLDGTTLQAQIGKKWARELIEGTVGYAGASWLVVLAELGLAAAWLLRRATLAALAVGVGLHVGIELTGFRIGQFSYVMLALYLLMLPTAMVRVPKLPEPRGAIAIAALGVALVAGVVAWLASPLPVGAAVVVVTAAIAGAAFAVQRTATVGAAHLAACLLALVLAHATDQAVDYYRFWAGSARRLGNTEEMQRAYRALLEIAPGHGSANYYLGHGALEARELDRALDHFRRAQAAEPGKARAFVGEARVQLALGDAAAARAALDQALRNSPGDPEATQLLQSLDAPAP
jgi:hypothetical protein